MSLKQLIMRSVPHSSVFSYEQLTSPPKFSYESKHLSFFLKRCKTWSISPLLTSNKLLMKWWSQHKEGGTHIQMNVLYAHHKHRYFPIQYWRHNTENCARWCRIFEASAFHFAKQSDSTPSKTSLFFLLVNCLTYIIAKIKQTKKKKTTTTRYLRLHEVWQHYRTYLLNHEIHLWTFIKYIQFKKANLQLISRIQPINTTFHKATEKLSTVERTKTTLFLSV